NHLWVFFYFFLNQKPLKILKKKKNVFLVFVIQFCK
ncbi:unnamed protein product, partial [Staurois parvus]